MKFVMVKFHAKHSRKFKVGWTIPLILFWDQTLQRWTWDQYTYYIYTRVFLSFMHVINRNFQPLFDI
ncbi:hypothetical protein BpHYR1_051801 [Brachionus plicatilis]|uniref:Uncharacterized protein n=1 Tax=Brachionus plicatilis TaxID=10195 RepID=A0A3M7PA81_BRAPC|nr:hypothetical protein BpHYR1_051801 [Brachionus plicatilis]